MTTRRVAGILGILAVVLTVAGDSTASSGRGTAPEAGAPTAEFARWLAENPPGAAFWTGTYLEVLGLLALLFYFPALCRVIRPAGSAWDWLATAALGAGLTATAVKLASGSITLVVFDRSDGLSADVQVALLESSDWSDVVAFAIFGSCMLAIGLSIVVGRALPRWLGWAAVAIGVVGVASLAAGLGGPPTFLLVFLWILVSSVYVNVRPRMATD